MLGWIVRSSVTFRLLVLAAVAAIFVVGFSQLHKAPVDVLPEYVPPTVEIQTEALGLSAAEVEQLITVPMEQDLLSGVAFLDDIRSESLPGLSRIFMVFEKGTDLYRARQVVGERLTQAHALPNVSKPPQMLQPLSSTNRVMIVGASSRTLTPIQLGVLARWTIAPKLIGVEGVSNVSIWGFRDRQLQVQVDPGRLRDEGITLEQVIETAGNALWFSPLTFVEASTPGVGGFIDTPNQRLGVQHLSPVNSAADLAKIRVEGTGSRNLVLGDVAAVVESNQPLIGDALVDRGNGDLLFVVEKLPGANTLEVTRGLEAAISALRPGLAKVDFDTTVYRPASYLDRAIDNLQTAAFIAVGLLALALLAFLFRWRTAFIAFVVIPLSFLSAALVLWALGTTVNAIILAGLIAALALVVNDSVTAVDLITRRLQERGDRIGGARAARVIVEATIEARRPATYAALVVALATLPLFFTNALPGAFFPDLAGAFLLAVAVSMIVATIVTPALAALLLSRASFDRTAPVTSWLDRGYARALARVVSRPRWAYLAVGAVIVATAAAAPFASTSLLPTLKEDQVLIRWDGPPGTSLPEMSRITRLAAEELRSIPGVQDVGAHIGRAVGSDLSVNANSAELWVTIDPEAGYDATVGSIRRVIATYPGLEGSVGTFSNERAQTSLADRRSDNVVVRVYGEDSEVLRAQAQRVAQAVEGVDGVSRASVELPPVEPTIEIETDLAAAEANGIKPGDVRRAAATLLGGLVVGNLFEQQKVFEVVVWGSPATRHSLASIPGLVLDTPDGRQVRLGDVADVRLAPNPTVIERHAVSRFLDVAADVGGRDRDAVAGDIRDRLAEMSFPLEYHTEVLAAGGQPVGRLIGVGIGAAVGVLLLLQAFFASWRLAALTLAAAAIAGTGGVLAVFADGGTLNFGSTIALLAVFAIAVANGMLLIDRVRTLDGRAGQTSRADLVAQGARERLAPVVLAAVATIVALLPLAIRGDIAGYELAHTVALVVIGGLLTSTLLTLFVVPVLYLRFGPSAATEPEPLEALRTDLIPRQATPAPAPVGAGVLQVSVDPEPST